jgi:hypothetical protein
MTTNNTQTAHDETMQKTKEYSVITKEPWTFSVYAENYKDAVIEARKTCREMGVIFVRAQIIKAN